MRARAPTEWRIPAQWHTFPHRSGRMLSAAMRNRLWMKKPQLQLHLHSPPHSSETSSTASPPVGELRLHATSGGGVCCCELQSRQVQKHCLASFCCLFAFSRPISPSFERPNSSKRLIFIVHSCDVAQGAFPAKTSCQNNNLYKVDFHDFRARRSREAAWY